MDGLLNYIMVLASPTWGGGRFDVRNWKILRLPSDSLRSSGRCACLGRSWTSNRDGDRNESHPRKGCPDGDEALSFALCDEHFKCSVCCGPGRWSNHQRADGRHPQGGSAVG